MKNIKENIDDPKFAPPEPQFIERVHKKKKFISESDIISLPSLDKYFFQSISSDYLYEINFPKSCKFDKIDEYTLYSPNNYSHYYSIKFPPSLKIIENNTFGGCRFLDQIIFQKNDNNKSNLQSIGDRAFTQTIIQSINLPESITRIGKFCFPSTLSQIVFEQGAPNLEYIGKNCFLHSQLETFLMPTNLSAFYKAEPIFNLSKKLKTIIFDSYINKNKPISINYKEDNELISQINETKSKFEQKIQKYINEENDNEYFSDDEDDYSNNNDSKDKDDIILEYLALRKTQDFAKSFIFGQISLEKLEIFISNLNHFSFYNTPKLVNINLPKSDSCKYVKIKGCLYTCDMKKLIVAERNVKSAVINSKCQIIANYAFNIKCFEKVAFEKNSELKEISFFAFSESKIKKIVIPKTVEIIDDCAFYNCNQLESVEIPPLLKTINIFTFYATNLTEITIPKNVYFIEYGCFWKCSNLSKVIFEKNSNLVGIHSYAFACTKIESISIPKEVRIIDQFCFLNCSKLKSIHFENGSKLREIGIECFKGTLIEEIQVPQNIQYFDFSGSKMTSINFSNSPKLQTFSYFDYLQITQISIPSSVKEIYSFSECSNLKTVKIIDISKSKLFKILPNAFINCSSLTEFNLPSCTIFFGDSCFKNCIKYKAQIKIQSKNYIYVHRNAFENSGIVSFLSKCKYIRIHKFAFQNCTSLTQFSAHSNNVHLYERAFYNCSSLATAKLSPNAKYATIEEECFMNSGLKSFEFPTGLEEISDRCFKNCKNLSSLTFGENSSIEVYGEEAFYDSGVRYIHFPIVTQIIGRSCFEKCQNLYEIEFTRKAPKYVNDYRYGFLIGSYSYGCIYLYDRAFAESGIKSLQLPKRTVELGFYCFQNCSNLSYLSFMDDKIGIRYIPEGCFESTSIEEVTFPKSIEYIGKSSFKNCKLLRSITFMESHPIVSHYALANCKNLYEINCDSQIYFEITSSDYNYIIMANPDQINKQVYDAIITNPEPFCKDLSNINALRYIISANEKWSFNTKINAKWLWICDSYNRYCWADTYSNVNKIAEAQGSGYYKEQRKKLICCDLYAQSINIAKETEIIKSYAFRYSNLTKVNFESNSKLKVIKKSAFENLAIEEISIPNSVTLIEESAFRCCRLLKKVKLTKKSLLNEIGMNAFEKTAIETFIFPSTLEKIGDYAFYDCSKLKTIDNYSNEIDFGYNSFAYSSIEKIKFPQNSHFEASSFKKCLNLKQLNFLDTPNSLVFEEESFAFSGIEEIKIKCTADIKSNAFIFCDSLKKFSLNDDNITCEKNSFAGSNINSCILKINMADKLIKNQKELLRICINELLESNIEKCSLTLIFSDDDVHDLFLNHKCYVIDNSLIYADLIDNISLFEKITDETKKDEIKKNEILRISSKAKKLDLQYTSHIKKISWGPNCIVEDLGQERMFSYYNLVEITIPKLVEKIPPYTFQHCHFLKTVKFEEQSKLTELSEYCFSNTNIEEIHLPNSVKIIGKSSFSNTYKLKYIEHSSDIIEDDSFIYSGLIKITIPNNTTKIGNNAFQFCYSLKEININLNESKLQIIGSNAFSDTSIETINIPPQIETLESGTFCGCTKLKEVNISSQSQLKTIESYAFSANLSLEKINIPETMKNLFSESFLNSPYSESVTTDSNKRFYFCDNTEKSAISSVYTDRTSLILTFAEPHVTYSPEKEGFIENKCYVTDGVLVYVDLFDNSYLYEKPKEDDKDKVEEIKEIEIINVPNKVKKLDLPVLSHIKKINWGQNCIVEDLGQERMFSYYNLVEITIPKLVEKIPPYTFQHCHFLKTVKFEEQSKLTELSEYCFSNTNIEEIHLPNSVKIIGKSSFSNTYKLKYIEHSSDIIEDDSFIYSGLIKITIPNNTTKIGNNAFQFCYSLKEININLNESKLQIIGSNAFSDTSIETINIPPQIETLENGIFNGCTKLKTVNISNQSRLKTIKNFSFGCNLSLEKISLPKTIKTIYRKSFVNTPSLQSIMDQSNEKFYVMEDHSVYLNKQKLLFVPRNLKNYQVASFCNSILSCSFCGPNLEKVTFSGDSLKSIGSCAFAHSTSLKKIKIPSSVEFIGDEAFIDCQCLESIEFDSKSNLKQIPKFCFAFTALKSIILPQSIEIIDHSSFFLCQNLKNINIHETQVKYIGDFAFSHTIIEEITFPSSIKFIGRNILDGNKSLKLIDLSILTKVIEFTDVLNFKKSKFKFIQSQWNSNQNINDNFAKKLNSKVRFDNNNQNSSKTISKITGQKSNALIHPKKTLQIVIPNTTNSQKNININLNRFHGSATLINELPPLLPQSPTNERISDLPQKINELDSNNKDNEIEISAKECYVNIMAFNNLHTKVFKLNYKEYKWFNFLNNCSQIDEYVLNENIQMSLQKVNDQTIHKNRLLGFNYIVNRLKWENNDSIQFSEKLLTPFHFLDCSQLSIIDLEKDIDINSIPNKCFLFSLLKEISIPSSVKVIGQFSFAYCNNLEKVSFSNDSKLMKILKFAFYNCYNLKSFDFPNKIKSISNSCFALTGLESIEIPGSIKKIGSYSFYLCKKLSKVVLNEGINILGKCSFAKDISLKEISFPDSLATIKKEAFSNCDNLSIIKTTPNTKLTEINDNAFSHTQIEELSFNNELKKWFNLNGVPKLNKISFYNETPSNFIQQEDGIIYEKTNKFNEYYDENYKDNYSEEVKSIIIDSLQNHNVEHYTPRGYKYMYYKIEKILKKLNRSRFSKEELEKNPAKKLVFVPKNLEHLKINEDCLKINKHAFDSIENLTTIEYMKGSTNLINSIANNRNNFSKIKQIKMLGDFVLMKQEAFANFESLETVEFGESTNILNIPLFGFLGCKNLKAIFIPSSCISIEKGAFKDCINLKSVEFASNSLKIIKNDAFLNCSSLESIVIPSTIQMICKNSFMNCTNLKKVEFGFKQSDDDDCLSTIKKNAFRNCTSLLSFTLPKSCVYLGNASFMNCTSLQSFEYKGSKLKSIPCRTFYNCTSLTKFELLNLEFNFDAFSINSEAFMNCSSLKEVVFEDESKIEKTVKKIKNKIYEGPVNRKPSDKRQIIGRNAFYNCTSLENARFFLGNLELFAEKCFANCSSLQRIEINSQYWKFLIFDNLNTSALIGTPNDLNVRLFSENEYVQSIKDLTKKESHRHQKRHFKEHLSKLNKSFLCGQTKDKDKNKTKTIGYHIFGSNRAMLKNDLIYNLCTYGYGQVGKYLGFPDFLKDVVPISLSSRRSPAVLNIDDFGLLKPGSHKRIYHTDSLFTSVVKTECKPSKIRYNDDVLKFNRSLLAWPIPGVVPIGFEEEKITENKKEIKKVDKKPAAKNKDAKTETKSSDAKEKVDKNSDTKNKDKSETKSSDAKEKVDKNPDTKNKDKSETKSSDRKERIKPRQTCIRTFETPRITIHKSTASIFDAKPSVHTEYYFNIPRPKPPLNI